MGDSLVKVFKITHKHRADLKEVVLGTFAHQGQSEKFKPASDRSNAAWRPSPQPSQTRRTRAIVGDATNMLRFGDGALTLIKPYERVAAKPRC
jgi:hypothetical protein